MLTCSARGGCRVAGALSGPQRQVEEQWMAPRAGSLLGMSRTTRADKLVEHEFVIVRERGEQLAYEVMPPGRASTVFVSTSVACTTE